MKFCAKAGTFLFAIILGVVLTLGSICLGGVIVLTRPVGPIMESYPAFTPNDDIKDKTVLEYGQTVLETLKNYEETTFGLIEDTIGINITNTLSEALGLDAQVLRQSKVSTVAENILNSYTIEGMQTKFGFTLPDLPMFKEPEFLQKPIKEAFEYLSEELNFDTMTVRELNEKFGVTLGDMLSQESLQETPINQLGDKIGTLPLNNFVDITLQVEVDRYLAETVATATTINGVKYPSLVDWENGKTAFALTTEPSNLGQDSTFIFDNPADFLSANVYFDNIVDGEGNVIKTAKEVQSEWIAAYNAEITDENLKVVEFWQFAIENSDIYNAATSNNQEKVNQWVKKQWLNNQEYVTVDAKWEAWYAAQNIEEGLVFGKTIAEAKDIYFEEVVFNTPEAEVWKLANEGGTIAQYKDALYDAVKDTLTYYDYLPLFVAPIVPTVVVADVVDKEASQINTQYQQTIPEVSNLTLQYLNNAIIGSDGEEGLNAYMDRMTLADATEIKDTDHQLLKNIKDEPIANIGTAVSQQLDTMPLFELVDIITDAEANYENGCTATTAGHNEFLEALELKVGRTPVAYVDGMAVDEFDYFTTREEQTAWIEANNSDSITYYDELAWEVEKALSNTQWFVDETARAAAYADYLAVNTEDPAYDDLADKNTFGILKTDYNFAKPYAPTIDDNYVKVEASSKILQSIRNSTLGGGENGLNATVESLTVYDIYGDLESGAMTLISKYTKLTDMGDAMTVAMQTKTIGALIDAGILDLTMTEEQAAIVRPMTIQQIVEAYISTL